MRIFFKFFKVLKSLFRRLTGNLLKKQEKYKGVKGFLPLGCLPLWGSEGVILID